MKEILLISMVAILSVLIVCAESVAMNQIALSRHNRVVKENQELSEYFRTLPAKNDLL